MRKCILQDLKRTVEQVEYPKGGGGCGWELGWLCYFFLESWNDIDGSRLMSSVTGGIVSHYQHEFSKFENIQDGELAYIYEHERSTHSNLSKMTRNR